MTSLNLGVGGTASPLRRFPDEVHTFLVSLARMNKASSIAFQRTHQWVVWIGMLIAFLSGVTLNTMAQDFPRNPIEKKGYRLEYEDDFNTKHLDTTKWFPYYLPQWSSRAKSATNYEILQNQLTLKIDEHQEPWCPEFNGNVKVSSIQTGVFSGTLGSSVGQHRLSDDCKVTEVQTPKRLYTPKYGYFEIRAKAVHSNNNVCAFWMIGYEDQPHKSAEICIMEIKGQNMNHRTAVNGHGLRAFADPNLADQFYEEVFDIDASNFHIYAAEWKPHQIDFYLDNKKIRSIAQSPTYEMQFMLNIYEVPTTLEMGSSEMTYPKEFDIDYVRAYQPIERYRDTLR